MRSGKKWYKSKTIIAGIASILIGIGHCMNSDYMSGGGEILVGIATIFGRSVAIDSVEK